jgi:hypothetical protein
MCVALVVGWDPSGGLGEPSGKSLKGWHISGVTFHSWEGPAPESADVNLPYRADVAQW